MATVIAEANLTGRGTAVFIDSSHYTYSVASDTANGAIAINKLLTEIAASSLPIAVDFATTDYPLGDNLHIRMKLVLSSGQKTVLDGVVTAHDGIPETAAPEPVEISNIAITADNVIKMEQEPREGDAINYYGPNLCDRTTWHEGCTEVSEFELTDTGDLTTWDTNSTHDGPWIDMYHGKLFYENDHIIAHPSCSVKIEVDAGGIGTWVEKTMNTFDDADEDYSIDFDAGSVTFNSALTSGDKVRASFAKAPSTMLWTMAPTTGKRLKLMYAEIQFTTDIELLTDIVYETWAYNPADLPNKVMVTSPIVYKTLSDFYYESTGSYPVVPVFGGTGPRGIGNKEVVILPYNYSTFRDIKASQGVEIRIKTDKEHTGTMATITLYCLQEDE